MSKLIRSLSLHIVAFALLFCVSIGCNKGTPASAEQGSSGGSGEEIAWLTDLEPALAKAKETGQPIMIDFFATWCPPCKMLDKETYTDSKVIDASTNWVMVRIDVDKNESLAGKYGVRSIPTLVLLTPDGKEAARDVGFMPAGRMLAFMEKVQQPKDPAAAQ